MPSRSDGIPVEERLFSLVLALVGTRNGLTKNEILGTVQGYRQRYQPGGNNASLERQFERDKDDIRDLGVPLETIETPGDPGNNQSMRYRIPKGDYDLPHDITFSPAETTVLNLAAKVWREGSLSGESRRALLKLRSLGGESSEPLIGYAPRIRTRDAAFAPLTEALGSRRVVTFTYLKPGEETARKRRVAPLAVIQHDARWMVYGRDLDADEPRTFLLSRIVGAITTTSATFDFDSTDAASRALAELNSIWAANTAVVRALAGTDAENRLRKRTGTTVAASGELVVHFTDINLLADELAGFGPEVVVTEPEALREAVRTRLATTMAAHGKAGEL